MKNVPWHVVMTLALGELNMLEHSGVDNNRLEFNELCPAMLA